MEVRVQGTPSLQGSGPATVVNTHPKALVDSLVAAYCQERHSPHESTYGLYTKTNKYLPPNATLRSQNIKSGDTLYLKQKNELDDLLYYTNWKQLAIVTLIIGFLGIVFMCLVYTLTGGDIPFSYGIVVDAGSSHSEITVYHWEGSKLRGTGKVRQKIHFDIDGGISSFDPREAGRSLLFGLDNISYAVPEKERTSTPVYLGATAGMRLLNMSDPVKADAVLLASQMFLGYSGFPVKTVNIISGKDEGLFAWLSTNYLTGKLPQIPDPSASIVTSGALDLGGASTQISFEVPYSENASSEVINLKLYGRNYSVFSRSYLCFGANEALRRFLTELVVKNDFPEDPIDCPCFLTGFNLTRMASDLFGPQRPCTQRAETKDWFQKNPLTDKEFKFVGTGNGSACEAMVREMMDSATCSGVYEECFKPLNTGVPDEKFAGFSAYYWPMKYLNSLNTTLENFVNNVHSFCNESWNNVRTGKAMDRYIYVYCFQGTYIRDILVDKYKFNDKTWKNLEFFKKVNGYNVGWSLGYMINATNAIPAESPTPPLIAAPLFATLLVIFIILVMFSVVFAVLAHRKRKCQNACVQTPTV